MKFGALCLLAACGFQGHGKLDDAAPIEMIDAPPSPFDPDAMVDPDAVQPIADAAPDGGPQIAWWNTAWHARYPISITANAALVDGFQIGLAIDLDLITCNRSSNNEARVVYQTTTELPRVIDAAGTGASNEYIWFRLQAAIPAGVTNLADYKLYCGNAAPGAAPADPTAVFESFDDFAGNALDATWTANGAGITVSGGSAHVPIGTGFRSTNAVGPNHAVDFVTAAEGGLQRYWSGFQNGSAFATPWILWNQEALTGIHPEYQGQGNTYRGTDVNVAGTTRRFGAEHYGNKAGYRFDNAIVATRTFGATEGAITVRVHAYTGTAGGILRVDQARVRLAVDPVPTSILGIVETN